MKEKLEKLLKTSTSNYNRYSRQFLKSCKK